MRCTSTTMLLFVALTCSLIQPIVSTCDYMLLVKCLIDVLDEWAWTLYTVRNNVVTITTEQCMHLRELDHCIKDDTDNRHYCTHAEMLNASYTVSDLLTHRRNSGTFLKSYYLLQFACSPRGQEILDQHRTCLNNEHIGQMTLSASTYLIDKLFDTNGRVSADDACDALTTRIEQYNAAMRPLCAGEAAELMCRSLVDMFKNIYTEKLHDCDITCEYATDTFAGSVDDEQPTHHHETDGVGDTAAQGVDSTTGGAADDRDYRLYSAMFAIVIALIVR